jgi:hypothetical protein
MGELPWLNTYFQAFFVKARGREPNRNFSSNGSVLKWDVYPNGFPRSSFGPIVDPDSRFGLAF